MKNCKGPRAITPGEETTIGVGRENRRRGPKLGKRQNKVRDTGREGLTRGDKKSDVVQEQPKGGARITDVPSGNSGVAKLSPEGEVEKTVMRPEGLKENTSTGMEVQVQIDENTVKSRPPNT